MQFTSEQLAPEQEQARQWHMWLRGERCGRAPDDEGMSMGWRGREEDAEGWVCGGDCVWQTGVCQVLATVILRHSTSLYREDKDGQLGGEVTRPPQIQKNNNFEYEFLEPVQIEL